jgi:hypothetical protein
MNCRAIKTGMLAGIAGGIPFGAMMGAMGMLPMVGEIIGVPTVAAGIFVHLANSALIGAAFGALLDRYVRGGTRSMGFGAAWNGAAVASSLPSLMGHAIFGTVLGISYVWLRERAHSCGIACTVMTRT